MISNNLAHGKFNQQQQLIFITSKVDNDVDRVMHSKSDSIEIMSSDEADEVIKKLFDSLKNRYQNNLESMRGSEFVFGYVQLLYYKCHKNDVLQLNSAQYSKTGQYI